MKTLACLVTALGLLAAALAQEFKGVSYKAPAGWEESVESGTKVFIPKGLKAGEILALIMTGAVRSNGTSWEKQFTDTIELANDKGTVSDVSKVNSKEGVGLNLLVQTLKLDLQPIGKHERLYAQVSRGQQRVFVTVILNKDSLGSKYGDAISEFLAGLSFSDAVGKGGAKIPTGDSPDLYPGVVGWLPSGKGLPIPAPSIVNGKPVGLWWRFIYDPTVSSTKAVVHIYLADGTRASNPRLGGGMLYDLEGQRAQKGNTGVGTYTLSGGTIVERYDGFENKSAFTFGTDKSGRFFKAGTAAFRPLLPVSGATIVGQWQGSGIDYRFKADGTFESGMTHANGDFAVAGFNTGTYVVDGYLIMLTPKGAPGTVTILGKAGDELIIGSRFYRRR